MEIEKILNRKDLTLRLDGYLDTTTSPDLKQLLDETMDSIDTLTLDFANLEYVSSAGLRECSVRDASGRHQKVHLCSGLRQRL